MIGIDTNVLIRALTQDDPVQSPIAEKLLGSLSPTEPAFVSRIVIHEVVWALKTLYGYRRAEIVNVLESLLQSRDFVVEDEADIAKATRGYREGGAGFADHLVVANGLSAGCRHTVTFDRKASRISGAVLLE